MKKKMRTRLAMINIGGHAIQTSNTTIAISITIPINANQSRA
jgi:hypothetical protein